MDGASDGASLTTPVGAMVGLAGAKVASSSVGEAVVAGGSVKGLL